MKKIIALILSALMICGMLAACGETKPENGTVTPLPSESTNDTAKPEATKPESTEPEATTPDDTESTEPVDTGKEVSLGAMQGGVYTNEYIGFTCTLNENWTFKTSEELQELPENVSEILSNTDYAENAVNQIFDMQAENLTDLTSMNVVYTKLSATDRIAYLGMTEEEIVDTFVGEKDNMITAYAQAGIDVSDIEKVQVEFCGETRFATLTTATVNGAAYYILQLFDYHLGNYGVTITFASFVENGTSDLLALCSAIN